MTIIPAAILVLFTMIMLGGVDDTLYTVDRFCRYVINGLMQWLRAVA
jgi:hypothetical protein